MSAEQVYTIEHVYVFVDTYKYLELIHRPAVSESAGGLVDPETYEFEEPGLAFVEEQWLVMDGQDMLCSCQTEDQAETVKHTFDCLRYMHED